MLNVKLTTMKQKELKVRFNGDAKTILFDTTKLDEKINDVLWNYEYDWDKLESHIPIEVEGFAGENTYLTLIPSYFTTKSGWGATRGTCDFDIEVQLYNPKTDNEIIITDYEKNVEVGEAIYDEYAYYGVKQSDFL